MDEVVKSYLAGCLDCDGYFTIKRSTYSMRVRNDATQPVFSEKIGLKQVSPEIVNMLTQYFGGYKRIEKPTAKKGKPLYAWSVSDRKAITLIKTLGDYLIIKHKQAMVLLELRRLKELPRIQHGTFIMLNRWGKPTIMPRRIVDPDIIQAKERLFNQVKSLNNTRITKPVLL